MRQRPLHYDRPRLAPRPALAIDLAVGERSEGPYFLAQTAAVSIAVCQRMAELNLPAGRKPSITKLDA
jgi:hypothetical protein